MDVGGKVAWCWEINEIMHKLDADVIKGFHKLETLGGEKERALTFQTICWIVGGYGVDLFSPVEDSASPNTAITIRTIPLDNPSWPSIPGFIVQSQYSTGVLTYYASLKHRPHQPHCLPWDYRGYGMMTGSNSWGCRRLLETYSKHVQSLSKMRESFKMSTEESDLEMQTQIPTQVEWMVFSNLLAQYFLDKLSTSYWPNRKSRTDGFVRQVDPEGKDLGAFLTESLFSKYRMRVAKTSVELPTNALASVEIEITNSNDADHCSDFDKKILVALLYDNDD